MRGVSDSGPGFVPLPSSTLSDEREVPSAASSPGASSSASHGTGPRQKAVRVRHSAMYSDRPRRSQRNRGGRTQQSTSSRVEGLDAGKRSSNELGPTISDTSKFETLSLNDSLPALDSADGALVHAVDMGTGLPDSTDMTAAAAEESLSPRFDSMDDLFEYFWNSELVAKAARDKARSLSRQASIEKYEAQQALESDPAEESPPEESSPVGAEERYEGSKETIAENGKKWMSEEVRVAFQKYIKKEDDLKNHDYEFDELQHQCFHVENYDKIFHHFNFTVKLKEPGSSKWISTPYFAEVKEILTRKIYFCCPLDPSENGDCYACKNQQMDDLRHPVIGAFDRGSPDTVFPFMYCDSSSDDDDGPVYDEAWRERMRAAGVMVG